MPKRGRKFITEFLVPNLDNEKFGARLSWVNRDFLIFQIQWNHKSASVWTKEDCLVFMEWDKKQGHYKPTEKEYFIKSKQRFRAVLNKSIQDKEIAALKSNDKNIKLYCIGSGKDIPLDLNLAAMKSAKNDVNYETTKCLRMENNIPYPYLSFEEEDLTKGDFCNALKDHNYQNNEESRILDNQYMCYDDSSKNGLSLYPSFSGKSNYFCPKSTETSTLHVDILETPFEMTLENEDLEPYLAFLKDTTSSGENSDVAINGLLDQLFFEANKSPSVNNIQENQKQMENSKNQTSQQDDFWGKKQSMVVYLKKDKTGITDVPMK